MRLTETVYINTGVSKYFRHPSRCKDLSPPSLASVFQLLVVAEPGTDAVGRQRFGICCWHLVWRMPRILSHVFSFLLGAIQVERLPVVILPKENLVPSCFGDQIYIWNNMVFVKSLFTLGLFIPTLGQMSS